MKEKRGKIILVDTENVSGAKCLEYIKTFTKKDRAYLFYTVKSQCLHVDAVAEMFRAAPLLEFVACGEGKTGKNGLDFQLVTQLGHFIGKYPDAQYIIVSNDRDFDVVVEYWKSQGIKVQRDGISLVVCKSASDTDAEIFKKHSISDLSGIHDDLVKKYGDKEGTTKYREYKKHLKEIYQAM